MSSDPYEASGGAGEPGSWNRYPYVGGDPVNWLDSLGLWKSCPNGDGCRGSSSGGNSPDDSGGGDQGGGDTGGRGTDGGGGNTPIDVVGTLEKVFYELNGDIKEGVITNCGAFARYAAKALELSAQDRTAMSMASRMLAPTAAGGRGFNFSGGSAEMGGWRSALADSSGSNNQAQHAMGFFEWGPGIGIRICFGSELSRPDGRPALSLCHGCRPEAGNVRRTRRADKVPLSLSSQDETAKIVVCQFQGISAGIQGLQAVDRTQAPLAGLRFRGGTFRNTDNIGWPDPGIDERLPYQMLELTMMPHPQELFCIKE